MAHAGLLQVAEFSRCAGNSELLSICRDRFASVLVPNQIAPNGNFPFELARTKPYGYCLFNLDAMGTLCAILASVSDTVWIFETLDGRGIRKAVEYMFPFIADNRRWLLPAVAPAQSPASYRRDHPKFPHQAAVLWVQKGEAARQTSELR